MTYTKISELSAASALDGSEVLLATQSSQSVKVSPAQLAAASAFTGAFYAYPATPVTGATMITGEYIFAADAELNYSSSLTDAMVSAMTTFSELPSNTVAVLAFLYLSDSSTVVRLTYKRASGDTQQLEFCGVWADAGTNSLRATIWIPTHQNTLYITSVTADAVIEWKILGYKTGG